MTWARLPIKRLGEVFLGKMIQPEPKSESDVAAPYLRAAHVQPNGQIIDVDDKTMWFSEGELRLHDLRADDVVIVEGGAGYGRSAVVRTDRKGWGFQNSIVRVRPRRLKATGRFLDYALQAALAAGEIEIACFTATIPHFTADKVGAFLVPAPPVGEQRAIVDYLDRETTRIDTLIEEQKRLIEMLRERRDAEADALLGSPIQARHTTVKRVLRHHSRPAVAGLGVVTAFRDGVVTLRSNRREDGYTFSNTEHGYQEIRPGDLVFHALDGFAGAVGVSDSHGNATPVYHVCEATAGDDLAYVAHLLRYLGLSGFLATQAPNVRERSVDFRNWATFGRLPLALPPIGEQRRVAAHLDEQNAKTDSLIAETERFIELARERRSALIAAAVTGQIDVREAA
ncbi:restriction endonuclease subunit S [Streptomyces parvus]|uniref:restriction endonuclease subunit S n=1 Tax=Streptomyces parvus TaxID=66428 RepID=UPI00363F6739